MDEHEQSNTPGKTRKSLVLALLFALLLFLLGFACGVYRGPTIAHGKDWIPNPANEELMFLQIKTGRLIRENRQLEAELEKYKPAEETMEE